MIGIVLVSHGALAEQLIKSSEMLVGEGENMAFVGIFPGDDPDEFANLVHDAAVKADTGDGVLVLADLYGGTPNNAAFRAIHGMNAAIVTGMNLPMVMSAASERYDGQTLEELRDSLIELGREQVKPFG